MGKTGFRVVALILVLVMLVGVLPTSSLAAPAESMVTRISESRGIPGATVKVTISLEDNPGITSFKGRVSYDATILELQETESGVFVEYNSSFGGVSQQPQKAGSPITIQWADPTSKSGVKVDGALATLTFKILENAEGNNFTPINLTFDPDDIYDANDVNVEMTVISGGVSVLDCLPGDINGDTKVNNKDFTRLFQYLADWDVYVNEGVLDTNGDGKVNNKDATRLFQYLADWDVELFPKGATSQKCNHQLIATESVEATCTEAGHTAYWQCSVCGKYFGDSNASREIKINDTIIEAKGHTIVIDPAVPATTTHTGLTEGSHCSVCGEVIVAQEETPILEDKQHNITYDIANGDSYLEKLQSTNKITNSNPARFSEDDGLTLRNISVAGYRFLGWYDGAGSNADQVKKINAGTTYDVELYAHWEKIEYTVQYKSDLYLEKSSEKYTVDTGLVLQKPQLSNYVFTGWSDENGELYGRSVVPVGTTGNITLTANWTSERNKTWTKTKLDEPIVYIDEDNKAILFAYEIGEIQNVPLYVIKDFGYISGDGVTKTETATYSTTISSNLMQSYTRAVASATTESSDWTLSSNWNDVTTLNAEYYEEHGMTQEEAEAVSKSESGNWNISSGKNGSTATTNLTTKDNGWTNQAKINGSSSTTDSSTDTHTDTFNREVHADVTVGRKAPNVTGGIEVSGTVGGSLEWGDTDTHTDTNSKTSSSGFELSGTKHKNELKTDSTVSTSGWNNTSSYGGSNTSSRSQSSSNALSESISEKYGYGHSYSTGGGATNARGLSSTQSASDEYSASVTYSTTTSASKTNTWTTQATKAGYHRWVVAGTAHVFGVVGYDMTTKSYFVYTFSVMDDETHEFEDYSYSSDKYNDQQNGVIPFEIPYDVVDRVAELTCYSEGLKVDQNTGIITEYNGTDTCVVIPEYMNVGNGKVVKITGISTTAFSGNTDIMAVVLSDFITEIPNNAFRGCTSLVGVFGGAITKIGDNAFFDCNSAERCCVTYDVTSLGSNAFYGVDRLLVNASRADVVISAANSGARNIELFVNKINGGTKALEGMTIEIPTGTDFFAFNGYGQTFNDFSIVSNADVTVVREATFNNSTTIPLQIASADVVFNNVTSSATGLAMALLSETAKVGLQGTIEVSSINDNALLCKNISLYEVNSNVLGKMSVLGKLLICGNIEGSEYISYQSSEVIDSSRFDGLLHSYMLYFNANGGLCGESSREVANGTSVGMLPTPTRQYYTFTGWYLEDGTRVTENTVFSSGLDQTVYAHWTPNTFTLTFNANGGSCSTTSKNVTFGAAVGDLPTPIRDYYNFTGWFLENGTQVTASTSFDSDVNQTVFARWTQKPVSDWVLASSAPQGSQVVETKWTYKLREETESRETSLSGYTRYDGYWVQSGNGSKEYSTEFPDTFDTSNAINTMSREAYSSYENETAKRDVSNTWKGYVYWHWMYPMGNYTDYDLEHYGGAREVSGKSGVYASYGSGYTTVFRAFKSSTNYSEKAPSIGSKYIYNAVGSTYNCWDEYKNYKSWSNDGNYLFFRFSYYTSSYTDYYRMFKYYRLVNKESSTQVNPSSTISDVQQWVKYREK